MGEGKTAGDGRSADSVVDNRDFFRSVVSQVVRTIGTASGEAPVYRIDLRLRPYGREGDTVWEVERAADYYRNKAQSWERQALIRARSSAGSNAVVTHFLDLVRDVVFRAEPLPDALADVRRLKEKIDRKEAAKGGGFNVKLGRGGIREIEFIAQALQLAYGGREPGCGRPRLNRAGAACGKELPLGTERARLSAAYTFLRTVEHRLQMEHGVQTHVLPVGQERWNLVARRCGYMNKPDPGAAFAADLEFHTTAVRAIYTRVFQQTADKPATVPVVEVKAEEQYLDDETERLARNAAAAVDRLDAASNERAEPVVARALPRCISPVRSLRNLTSWAESLATYDQEARTAIRDILSSRMPTLIERLLVVLSSPYIAQIIVSRPALAAAVTDPKPARTKEAFLRVMKGVIDRGGDLATRSDALRRTWYEQVVEIGYRDLSAVSGQSFVSSGPQSPVDGEGGHRSVEAEKNDPITISKPQPSPASEARVTGHASLRFGDALRANNLEQTALAEASLQLGIDIALESLDVKQGGLLRYAVLGLGRLGHTGMDYGSDLDLLVVFDDQAEWAPSELGTTAASPQEFYAGLTSRLVRVLSSVTREGFIYRIDLRLRPDGQSGPLAQGLGSLVGYLGERASAWEHSAYLKVREVAGDLDYGVDVRNAICEAAFDAASRNPSLRQDLAHVKARLEREKGRSNRRNIKWGPGGMTDVYFVTRYLQLRHRVRFGTELGTTALIAHLGECGHLDEEDMKELLDGYAFLRSLDHWMRLLVERPSPILPASHVVMGDIARAMDLGSLEELENRYSYHTEAIRKVYARIFE
jgi:glutamate-ammonia-ligase adenylyltransferase